MTQTPQDPDLFSDLQQFLYDARDQFLALENIRAGLDEIAKTAVSQRKGVAASQQKLDRAIQDGVSVTVNAGLEVPIAKLTKAISELQSMVTTARQHARPFLYTQIGLTMLSACVGAAVGLYIGVKIP
jgi:hypothetical protein